ncbi:hypothetical protein Bp8pS_313 [Bacillus phage vB_BpuM-BpSp]|nr:hypothetical protein Bp8pS_313 [Bacillus phage vB_BpuM-BpSp]
MNNRFRLFLTDEYLDKVIKEANITNLEKERSLRALKALRDTNLSLTEISKKFEIEKSLTRSLNDSLEKRTGIKRSNFINISDRSLVLSALDSVNPLGMLKGLILSRDTRMDVETICKHLKLDKLELIELRNKCYLYQSNDKHNYIIIKTSNKLPFKIIGEVGIRRILKGNLLTMEFLNNWKSMNLDFNENDDWIEFVENEKSNTINYLPFKIFIDSVKRKKKIKAL